MHSESIHLISLSHIATISLQVFLNLFIDVEQQISTSISQKKYKLNSFSNLYHLKSVEIQFITSY